MNSDSIRQTYQYTVQVLTPVHIGCGKSYIQHFDFIQDGQKVRVFDHNRLFVQVEGLGEQAISALTAALETEDMAGFVKECKVNLDDALRHSFSLPNHTHTPRDIRQYIRDGMGRPIIPGSSLKGLFRSAILSRLVGEQGQELVERCSGDLLRQKKIIPKYADAALTRELFGRDAKFNLMRSLAVTDCTLEPSAVRVEPAVVTRLVGGGTTFAPKNWKIWIEGLRPGANATGQVSFDMYLQREAQDKEQFAFKAILTLEWLVEALRLRTRSFLEKELVFLDDKRGNDAEALRQFYTRMQREIDRLAPNEAIAQFAWGSGWKGMTGEVLGPELSSRADIRNLLKLAPKYLEFPFPKSRRLIDKAQGTEPIGWVKFIFKEKSGSCHSGSEKSYDSSQISLKRIEAAQSWDDLKKVALSELNSEKNHIKYEIAEAFKEAALRVKTNFPKTWTSERDQQVADWLAPSGVVWPMQPAAQVESPQRTLLAEEQQRVDRILALEDWGEFKSADLIIEKLSLSEAEALKQVFCRPKLGVNKKSKNEEKKKTWKALEAHLRKMK